MTDLEMIGHCLKETRHICAALRTVLEIAEPFNSEADVDLNDSCLVVCRTALIEAIGFIQSATICHDRLTKGHEKGAVE